jgi:hypothetical protein
VPFVVSVCVPSPLLFHLFCGAFRACIFLSIPASPLRLLSWVCVAHIGLARTVYLHRV